MDAKYTYPIKDRLNEEDRGWVQLCRTAMLLEVAAGRLDMQKLAHEELAARGVGLTGHWIGFEAARHMHGLKA